MLNEHGLTIQWDDINVFNPHETGLINSFYFDHWISSPDSSKPNQKE